jgi:hypothetical protein
VDYEYKKRSYLLPEGCKDLIDVLKPKARLAPIKPPAPPASLPSLVGEITVAERMTVRQLAALLKQKPFQIVADLLEFRVMASVEQSVSFDIVALVARKHGYLAKKAV